MNSEKGVAPTSNPLDAPVRIRTLRELNADGIISDELFTKAVGIIRPQKSITDWVMAHLLIMGVTLLLSGIMFFFAYNWAGMHKFLKLGLVGLGVVGSCFAAHRKGLENFTGKTLLMVAAMLVGVLLAVYGQTYQTGADPYTLFLGWAILILGWVVIAEFAPLAIAWLIILNIGLILYNVQVSILKIGDYNLYYPLAFLLNGVALSVREWGLRKGLQWLSSRWLLIFLLCFAFSPICVGSIKAVFDDQLFAGTFNILLSLGASVGCSIYYIKWNRDMAAHVVVTCYAMFTVIIIFPYIIRLRRYWFEALPVVILVVIILGVNWLKFVARMNKKEVTDE